MKFLISVCVLSVFLVVCYGIPRKFQLVYELTKAEKECKEAYPYNQPQQTLCANYKFGILEDADNGPKINYRRLIAAAVEYSKYLHAKNRSVPVLSRRALFNQAKYCNQIKSTDPLTLLVNVQLCMSQPDNSDDSIELVPFNTDFDNSGEDLVHGSKAKPLSTVIKQLAQKKVY